MHVSSSYGTPMHHTRIHLYRTVTHVWHAYYIHGITLIANKIINLQ